MSMMDRQPGMGPDRPTMVLCPVVECPECGEDALAVRRFQGTITLACACCAQLLMAPENRVRLAA